MDAGGFNGVRLQTDASSVLLLITASLYRARECLLVFAASQVATPVDTSLSIVWICFSFCSHRRHRFDRQFRENNGRFDTKTKTTC